MPSLGSYLQPVLGGDTSLKDYAHASNLYRTGKSNIPFALAPKAGWIYYVVFNFNPDAVAAAEGPAAAAAASGSLLGSVASALGGPIASLIGGNTTSKGLYSDPQAKSIVGMLVKNVDLPKFQIQTEVVNQYNRKTVIQKGITYNPVNFTFHDDQYNVIHNMWTDYYKYYFADSNYGGTGPIGTNQDGTPFQFANNKYTPINSKNTPTAYGLNSPKLVNDSRSPFKRFSFFENIIVYQMNQKMFTSFQLVNPVIAGWEHDRMDQTQGNKLVESKMTINYEAVIYGSGKVKKDTPAGFATFDYDTSPSPLSIAGGGNSSIFGPGGIVSGAESVFGDVSNIANGTASPLNVLGAAISTANLVRNVGNISKDSLRAEGYSILTSTLQNVARGGLNGLGLNLGLQKGKNTLATGEYVGTPVAVTPPATPATPAGGAGPAAAAANAAANAAAGK